MRNREPTAQEGFEPYGEYAAAPGAQQPASSQDAGLRTQAQKRRRTSLMFKLLVLLTCLCIMLIVLQETVFRLQAVYVVGNETRTPQEVAAASGLVRGRSIFSITREEVEASLSRDHTLIFEDMQIQYPNTVYLYVRERTPAAVMSWLGILYLLDDEGMVMSQIRRRPSAPGHAGGNGPSADGRGGGPGAFQHFAGSAAGLSGDHAGAV